MEAIKKLIESGRKCIVRTEHAGVFFGRIVDFDGTTAEIRDCRRIWYWAGAASLSQLANDGPSRPRDCKFPEAVESIVVFGVKEVIPCTDVAAKKIEEVWTWKA
jgi:hypothetical protein